jgi:TIR domain
VRKLRDALDAAGIDVWFDQRHLEGGDDFDQQIKRNIRGCSLFLPVISANTQARHEGYFRLEWSLAAERAKLIAETIPFILPVTIDPVAENEALVPERFRQVQWTRLPGGEPTAEFVERMVRLIRDFRKRERGLL